MQILVEPHVRPAGFFRVKAARLQVVAGKILSLGGMDRLSQRDTGGLRRELLSFPGIGEETADAILLYAFNRPVVVIDAYLRRLMSRLLGTGEGKSVPDDRNIRALVASTIPRVRDLSEFHALIVAHGKQTCRPRPHCASCCLLRVCPGSAAGGS